MSKKQHTLWAAGLLAIFLAGFGCGHKDAQALGQVFDRAPAEIKANWDQAVAADKANNYYVACTNYAAVLAQETKLTPKQLAALESASRELLQRARAAAESGDEAAKQALQRLMQEHNGRP